MNKKLIEQITTDLLENGPFSGHRESLEAVVSGVIEYLTDTQILTYTFDDPEGANFCYPDLDDLALDIMSWDDGQDIPWAVYAQIEFREPVHFIQIVNGNPELVQ